MTTDQPVETGTQEHSYADYCECEHLRVNHRDGQCYGVHVGRSPNDCRCKEFTLAMSNPDGESTTAPTPLSLARERYDEASNYPSHALWTYGADELVAARELIAALTERASDAEARIAAVVPYLELERDKFRLLLNRGPEYDSTNRGVATKVRYLINVLIPTVRALLSDTTPDQSTPSGEPSAELHGRARLEPAMKQLIEGLPRAELERRALVWFLDAHDLAHAALSRPLGEDRP